MGDHYSEVKNTIYRQRKEAQRKEIKSRINKLKDEDLQLVDDFIEDINLFRSFFTAIKRIIKIDL